MVPTARKRGSPAIVAEDGEPDFGQCGGRVDEEQKRCSLGCRSFKNNGRSGCGIVIKGVDREKWVTISQIAVPLKVGAAMAEIAGVCVLTSILDLILCKCLSVQKHQSKNQSNPEHQTDSACTSTVQSVLAMMIGRVGGRRCLCATVRGQTCS